VNTLHFTMGTRNYCANVNEIPGRGQLIDQQISSDDVVIRALNHSQETIGSIERQLNGHIPIVVKEKEMHNESDQNALLYPVWRYSRTSRRARTVHSQP